MSTIDHRREASRTDARVVSADVKVWDRMVRMWRERQLLYFLVGRDLKVKYKNSILGFAWSLLNPALVIVVYVFVFQVIMKNRIPGFAIYLMCGLVLWNFFSGSLSGGCASMVGNGHLIKQVSFSREILALSAVGTSAVFGLFQLVILVGALGIVRYAPSMPYVLLIPLALVALVILAGALAIFFSAVNVYFRDVQHLLEVVLMAWFWGCPIVYTWSYVGPPLARHHLTWLYNANPVTPIVLLFQRALYGYHITTASGASNPKLPKLAAGLPVAAQFSPLWYVASFGVIIAVSLVLLVLALKIFGRLEGNFAEEL